LCTNQTTYVGQSTVSSRKKTIRIFRHENFYPKDICDQLLKFLNNRRQ
jgi:hypothetical protein